MTDPTTRAALVAEIEADRTRGTLRPLPILMQHFPSCPAVDFNDPEQRMWLRCSCGLEFRNRDHKLVMEHWAHHAMNLMDTGSHDAAYISELEARVRELETTLMSARSIVQDVSDREPIDASEASEELTMIDRILNKEKADE